MSERLQETPSRLQIIRAPHLLKWVSLLCAHSNFTSSKFSLYVSGSHNLAQKVRSYGTESSIDLKNGVDFGGSGKKGRAVRAEAQSALVEYFHLTRSFRIMDAENMSKNAPEFFNRLMKRVVIDDDSKIKHSVTRFLRYHPVNEFEPFFESIGLRHSEYAQYLPRNLMFLADDELLLENYYVLCNYGIERNRIGKIFKEANEVFRYDYGSLQPKLRYFENLGLRQSIVAKIVAASPNLLRGNVGEFVEFLEMLKKVEIEYEWLLEHIREEDSYDWKCMLQLMCLFCKSGWSMKQVGELFKHHPDLLLECSGRITFGIIGLLLKFGATMSDVHALFLQFPQIPVLKFTKNLHNSYIFLSEIDMAAQDIGKIVCSNPALLGSIELKKVKSILSLLSCGKNKLCQMVNDDPFTLEAWVLGRRVEPLDTRKRAVKNLALRTEFLLSLGFKENSKDMEKALKALRGRGEELQERFNCLVNNGVSCEEAIKMVRISPQVLNQTRDVIETKIRLFFDELGYQASDLLTHPKILSYTIKRVTLRLLTYRWLKDQGAARPGLSLSTLLATSDEEFIKTYVTPHAGGPEFWKSLNKKHINK
ncbi:transcription termination factor MTEF18, mitochondrial-like [Salvia miltiorrhiza]|uniref:transcription termination factor MTEF18, mitochondrial-like n=1 Tax=Salvia miltiorrhiza TaxID=226208 RepID=UPI0025AC5895|nr:transcription termination factor MTEF18, mitochondrial-like [Salvia miltiorrhiza]